MCLRLRGIYLSFYARKSYCISQHVKKTRKSALREKVDRYDDEWTGDDDDDDDDGQVRRGGTAIAMRGTEAGGGQGVEDHYARRDLHSIWCIDDIPCVKKSE